MNKKNLSNLNHAQALKLLKFHAILALKDV